MPDVLLPVVQVAFTKDGVTFRALAPASPVTVRHTTEAAVAALDRACLPGDVCLQIDVLLATHRAAADFVAVGVALAVDGAKLPAAVLADCDRRQTAAGEDPSDLAGVKHDPMGDLTGV